MPSASHSPDQTSRVWQITSVLSLLVCFFLYCDSFLCYMNLPAGNSPSGFHIFLVWIGMFVAQPALLAMWAAFGTEPATVRMPRALLLVCLVSLAFTYGTWLNMAGELGTSDVAASLMPITQFVAATIAFWIVRKVRGWQIVGPYGSPDEKPATSTQFSLLRLLVWQSLCAIVIALALPMFKDAQFDNRGALRDAFGEILTIGAFYGLISLSIAFNLGAILGTRNRLKHSLAALGVALGFLGLSVFIAQQAAGSVTS